MTASTLCRDCDWLGEGAPERCPRCGSPRLLRHPEVCTLTMAHVDCDAFYASVEKRDRPDLRDRPVIVGGGRRGVVTTACYVARVFGVRSAMPMFKALRLCPEAVVIPPDFAKYRAESRRIMERLEALTPLVQPLSLDEAWLDLTGSERLHGGPAALTLSRVQRDIERDIGLSVSIGLATNKFLAKIASDLDKPRGFAMIGASEAMDFLSSRPVAILPGVGPAFETILRAEGFGTVGDLCRADPRDLARRFGAQGLRLAQLARGEDPRPVDPDQGRKSISAETTFDSDLARLEDLEARLWPLCERVARQARAQSLAGEAVTLKLRAADFHVTTRRKSLPAPTQTARTLFETSRRLLRVEVRGSAYRLIGVGLSHLGRADAHHRLFPSEDQRSLRAERALDGLRARFGAGVVFSARDLK